MKAPILRGYVYNYEEARHCRDRGGLLSIRVETSRACNLRCSYCCNKSGMALPNEISYECICGLISEAKVLGAESIVVIGGGEPTIYPKFKELIEFIDSNNLIPVIFTNTQTMSLEMANFLYKHNVSVLIKLDSLNNYKQDAMVGIKGASIKIKEGLGNLFQAGYGHTEKDNTLRLGASFVVNKRNYDEVTDIWRYCRNANIFPNLEMMIPNGNAIDISSDLVSSSEWKILKNNLLKIDANEYNYTWFPYTPLVGAGCFQVMYNLYITVEGDVRPCSSIHCQSYNIQDYSLSEIIHMPFFERARHIDEHLQGKCQSCDQHNLCIGCRGLAFASNKSKMPEIEALCAEDPSCEYLC